MEQVIFAKQPFKISFHNENEIGEYSLFKDGMFRRKFRVSGLKENKRPEPEDEIEIINYLMMDETGNYSFDFTNAYWANVGKVKSGSW